MAPLAVTDDRWLISRSRRRLYLAVTIAMILIGGCRSQGEPQWQQTRDRHAAADMQEYHDRAPKIEVPLTLRAAIDYAQSYNIDVWIAAHEREYQRELTSHAKLMLLPGLIANAEVSKRSTHDASSSQSLTTGEESLELSFSSEKQSGTFDISAMWNLLDFGIAFSRIRQQKNREFIALQRERRLRQNLSLQVTQTYWRAISTRDVTRRAERVVRTISQIIESLHSEIAEKAISRIDALKRETALLIQREELCRYRRGFLKAKTELAKLIGLAPGTEFTLAEVDLDSTLSPQTFDAGELEWEALRRRPELFEKDFEQAISRDEGRIALAKMFPSLAVFWRYDTDTNRFLAFNQWYTVGLRASWNLLAIPQQLKQHDAIQVQTRMIATRRTAAAVAILAQLHMTLIDYEDAIMRYRIKKEISDKHTELLEAIASTVEEGKSHQGELLDYKIKQLRSRAKYLSAHSNLKTAVARLMNTIGQQIRPAPATQPSPATQPAATTQPAAATQPVAATQPAPATQPAVTTQPAASTQPAAVTTSPAFSAEPRDRTR